MLFLKRFLIMCFVLAILLPNVAGAKVLAKSMQKKGTSSKVKEPEPSETDSQEEENESLDEYQQKYSHEISASTLAFLESIQKLSAYFSQQPAVSTYPEITTPPPKIA